MNDDHTYQIVVVMNIEYSIFFFNINTLCTNLCVLLSNIPVIRFASLCVLQILTCFKCNMYVVISNHIIIVFSVIVKTMDIILF